MTCLGDAAIVLSVHGGSFNAQCVHTRPQLIFGLAGACADKVQAGMNMRGLAGPGGERGNKPFPILEQFL